MIPARLWYALLFVAVLHGPAVAQELEISWDFKTGPSRWSLEHDLAADPGGGEGAWPLRATGSDPYLSSPAIDLRCATAFELEVTWQMESSGGVQAFWTAELGQGFAEERSVRATVRPGEWTTTVFNLDTPRLARVRLDPGSAPGKIQIRSLRIRPEWRVDLDEDPDDPRRLTLTALMYAERRESAPLPVRVVLDGDLSVTAGPGPEEAHVPPGELRRFVWKLHSQRGGVHVSDVFAGPRRERRAVALPEVLDRPPPPDAVPDRWIRISNGPGGLRFDRERFGTGELAATGAHRPFALLAMPHCAVTFPDGSLWSADPRTWRPDVEEIQGGVLMKAGAQAPNGNRFSVSWRITAGALPGVFELAANLAVTESCGLLHWMPVALFPGLGSFGPHHAQALFPGLEYLDADEPSSSDKDDRTPSHVRFLPDPLKVTVPLMVLAYGGHHAALGWSPAGEASPIFSVPDRLLFEHQGSLLGLVVPACGLGRGENELLSDEPWPLDPARPLIVRATLLLGEGELATGALKTWLQLRPPPPLPGRERTPDQDRLFLARSLLDSALWDSGRNGYGHCVEPEWARDPCADIAGLLLRLSREIPDPAVAGRLRERARGMLLVLPPEQHAAVTKTHALVRVAPFLDGGLDRALRGLEIPEDRLDPAAVAPRLHLRGELAESHFEDTAVGLVASVAVEFLEAARFTGDSTALSAGRRVLSFMERFDGGVPRGAQTWEIPLHTPDILASARAALAFTLAYELEGRPKDLERAKDWAWTGVPFVYLWGAPDLPIMRYATIPVFGATHYRAPKWIGFPVQWCGLSYAEALFRLARHDPSGPWKLLADGITSCALQLLVPEGRSTGCLPDSFILASQHRQGPMINPGGVLALLADLDGRPPLLDFARFKETGILLHVPGRIIVKADTPEQIAFQVEVPGSGPFEVAVLRVPREPVSVTFDGRPLPATSSEITAPRWKSCRPEREWLIFRLPGPGEAVVTFGP